MQSGSEIWTGIHDEVQRVLESLDDVVRSRVRALRVAPGRTQGSSFYLFTYRTFSHNDGADIDPVVAGITFSVADSEHGNKLVVNADISGESSGDIIKVLAPRVVPATREELLLAAREPAMELADNGAPIADALLDPSRTS